MISFQSTRLGTTPFDTKSLKMQLSLAFLFFLVLFSSLSDAHKLCAKRGDPTLELNCRSLQAATKEVQCVFVEDAVDCLQKLEEKSADFGVFTAEEALAVAAEGKNLKVIAEVRHSSRALDPYAFTTVAVVRSNFTGGIEGLRGKKYCHPGFTRAQYWTDPVMKALEQKILRIAKPTSCNENQTVVERDTETLSKFFSSSCRPGQWTVNNYMDGKLKSAHRNLCSLCDNPGECVYNTQLTGTHYAALNCLAEKGGDVAYTSLMTARDFFNYTTTSVITQFTYNFLCPDGSTQSIFNADPCAWIKQPWTSILASEDKAYSINGYLKDAFPGAAARASATWQERLKSILVGSSGSLEIGNVQSIKDYVERGREIPSPQQQDPCSRNIKLCTVSQNERDKCRKLEIASKTHGIVPSIECPAPLANHTECLRAVNQSDYDIAVIPTNEGFIARKTYNLAPLMYVENDVSQDYFGVIVVRANATFKSISQLKGKRACFPLFNGLGWLSFMEAAWNSGDLSKNACPAGPKSFKFFGDSCAPGANDPKINNANLTVPASVCAACSQSNRRGTCEASTTNSFYGEIGALRCLASGAGEVAFLDYNVIKPFLESLRNGTIDNTINPSDLRILCKDGTISTLEDPNLDNCATLQVIAQEVITRKLQNIARSRDIQFALEELVDWFGGVKPERTYMRLFGKFHNISNLIFPDSGLDLLNTYMTQGTYVNKYSSLHSQLQHCSSASGSVIGFTLLSAAILLLSYL